MSDPSQRQEVSEEEQKIIDAEFIEADEGQSEPEKTAEEVAAELSNEN